MLPHAPSNIFPGALANIDFLASSGPVSGLHEFRAVCNARRLFNDVLKNSETIADRDNNIEIDHNLHPVGKKRRLTNEQVKSLEVSFEKESKLEPERKNHLAEELGLQPRQIAIWFQNRRARCKTKQLEQEYEILKHQYDAVRMETDKLVAEVARLRNMLDTEAAASNGIVASSSGWRSMDQEHEILGVTAQNLSEYHLQQNHKVLQSKKPTLSRVHYKRSPSCAISTHMDPHRELDTSSDSDQTESLEARMLSPEVKYISQKYHQHAEAKLSVADSRCSSQLLHHMAVQVEESFDLYDEILHTIDDPACESMAMCLNWQRDA